MDNNSAEIICAVATPDGTSALSVIRLSGEGSQRLVEGIMSLEKNRLDGMRRKVGMISVKDRIIDHVVAYSWPEGRSFTGEEMVEIVCHGVPDTIMEIMDTLKACGAREAEPGEFSRRALGNGRMSALQVIELAGLWDPQSKQKEFTGETEKCCNDLLREIDKAREVLEGNIEFAEEHHDVDDENISRVLDDLSSRAESFKKRAFSIEKSSRVMIMGPANSGKSTLFNLLIGRNGAIVSDEPGTTRDGSTCYLEIGGKRILLCDTAGTDGMGLDRKASEAVIDSLDGTERIVWMSVGGTVPPARAIRERGSEIIGIAAMSDLENYNTGQNCLSISSKTGEGIEELKGILSRTRGSRSLSFAAEVVEQRIIEARTFLTAREYDLSAEMLKQAEIEARRIIGRGENIQLSVERALAAMCVGK